MAQAIAKKQLALWCRELQDALEGSTQNDGLAGGAAEQVLPAGEKARALALENS